MTQEQILEYAKCVTDPIYFLNNYGFVFDLEKQRIGKLSLYPYQVPILKDFENFRNNIILKSRQQGLSVITAGYVAWSLIFGTDERILIVANDRKGAIRFADSVRIFLDNTPEWMLPSSRIIDNQQELKLSNGCQMKTTASSPQAGRGESLTLLILDETAFIEHADSIWLGAGMALSVTGGKCIMISCVPKDTMVISKNGIKEINDFVIKDKVGGYGIKEYEVFGKDKLRKGSLMFNNGIQKTKIISSTNAKIETTFNHKLWACKNGKYDWYKSEDLNEGDYISIQYGMEQWGNNDDVYEFKPTINNKIKNVFNPKKINKDIAYLIGLYISVGSVYKKYKKEKFIGGSVTITCGDKIKEFIKNADLSCSCYDNLHYSIGSKNLIEFLEYLGFDLSKKAKEKEIPSRLLEMSRENIIYMLRGIFDGDGCARKDKGYVCIGMSSKKLINQIRMILLNLGVLTDYEEKIVKPTKKVKKESKIYKISCNAEFSKIYYEKIGFSLERKQKNKDILLKYNLQRNSPNDVIPYSLNLIKKIIKESGFNSKYFKEKNIFINGIFNKKTEYKTQHISRKIFLKIWEICKNNVSKNFNEEVDKILSNNLKWNIINKIEFSEKETFDFSLPEDKDDFWCHSVLYNGVLGHQTPYGTGNLYHRTWVGADKKENDFNPIEVHWSTHPVLSKGLEFRANEFGILKPWSPWYETECKRFEYDNVKIAQELDLSFEGSRNLVVDNSIIERFRHKLVNNIDCYFDFNNPGNKFVDYETSFYVWKKPQENHNYIVAADVSRSDGSDYSTIQVIDAITLEQVAEYQGKVMPDQFAKIIQQISIVYNMAYVAVECNSFGLVTSLALKNELQYPSDKLFHSKSAIQLYNKSWKVNLKKDEDIPGWQTTSKTRPIIISTLQKYMREGEIIINSTRLLNEFQTFIYASANKNSNEVKAQHAPGYHDDLIFAFGIALAIRDTEYQNLYWSSDSLSAMIEGFRVETSSFNMNKSKIDSPNPSLSDMDSLRKNNNDDDLSWLLTPIRG